MEHKLARLLVKLLFGFVVSDLFATTGVWATAAMSSLPGLPKVVSSQALSDTVRPSLMTLMNVS